MTIERRIKAIERADGRARLFILERDDGLYRFEGETEIERQGDTFWRQTDISGLYGSAAEAERAALSEVLWL